MHSCPSGLRGSTQVRMYSYSWVQIPLNAINKYFTIILQNRWRTYHFILCRLPFYKIIEFQSHQGFVADSRIFVYPMRNNIRPFQTAAYQSSVIYLLNLETGTTFHPKIVSLNRNLLHSQN